VRKAVDAHAVNSVLQWVRNIRRRLPRLLDACAQTDKADKPCRGAAHRQSAHAKLCTRPRACGDPYAGKEFGWDADAGWIYVDSTNLSPSSPAQSGRSS